MANRACNLECVDQGGDDVVEFVGPVKIVLVNQPKYLYTRKRLNSALIVLSHMMMGAATMIVLYYSLSYEKQTCLAALHVLLGTAGLQICMPLAILSLNKLSGSSAPVKPTHRQCEHACFHTLAILCTLAAVAASFFCEYFQFTVHCLLGGAAALLAVFNSISGICVYDYWDSSEKGLVRKCIGKVHALCGIITFLLSSACFVSGLIKPSFAEWTPLPEVQIISVMFCVFYTLVILYKPIKDLFTWQ